tara:strand:+ start:1292 stop:1447 length:156 start_codon:yes stop_codon:yes gene_type:complete
MTDKQLKEWVNKYLRNDEIKAIRYDTRIKKSLMVLTRDVSLLILIIWILIN